jgi:hypothetical protein
MKPPGGARKTLSSRKQLSDVWDLFRTGALAPCPADAAPLALSVDGAAGLYRLVCTRCSTASAWFESGPKGIRTRGPRRSSGDDD